jgi:hypothetical protein
MKSWIASPGTPTIPCGDSGYKLPEAGAVVQAAYPQMAALDPLTGAVLLRPATDPLLFAPPAGAAAVSPLGGLAGFSGAVGLLLGLALLVSPVAVLGVIHARWGRGGEREGGGPREE